MKRNCFNYLFPLVIFLILFIGCSKEEKKGAVESGEKERVVVKIPPPPPPVKKEVVEKERGLKIGVLAPESGQNAVFGKKILRGILMAARNVNESGGINGKKIEVIHYDNKGDRDLTEMYMEKLTHEDNVLAILTAPTGWATFMPTHVASETRTIHVCIATRRHIEKSSPYCYRNSLPDNIATDDLIDFTTDEFDYHDYALVTSSRNDYSLSLSSLFRQAVANHDGRIVVEADTYNTYTGKTDIESAVKAIKSGIEKIKAIIYTGSDDEGAALAKALRRHNIKLPIIGGEDLYTGKYLKKGGDAVEGTLLYTTFSPDVKSKLVSDFVKKYKSKEGKLPDRFSALAYDSFMFMAESIKRANSTRPSDVKKAMEEIKDFKGVSGGIGFSGSGGPLRHPFIYKVGRINKSLHFILLKEKVDLD